MAEVDPFLVRLLLSFVVGGLWITLTTMAAEQFGSRLGGLLGGIPSTLVVALSFIGWTQGVERAHAATTALPLAFGVNCMFLLAYALLAHRGLVVAIVGALAVWATLQTGLVLIDVQSYSLALAGWAVALVGVYLVMDRVLCLGSASRASVRRTPGQVAWRALLSGGIVALAVAGSRLGGPVVGASMAAFPAVYVSTLVITSRSVGIGFSLSLLVPLMVSAVVNCVVFGTVFRFTVLGLGLPMALASAYVTSLGGAACTYLLLTWREASVADRRGGTRSPSRLSDHL